MSLLLDEWWVLSSHNHRTTKAAKKIKKTCFYLAPQSPSATDSPHLCVQGMPNEQIYISHRLTYHRVVLVQHYTKMYWCSLSLGMSVCVLALQWIGKALCLVWQLVYPPAKLDRQLTELMNDIDLTQLKLNMPFWYGTIIYIIVLILTYLQDVQCDLDSCLYVHSTRCHEKVQSRSAFFDNLTHISHTFVRKANSRSQDVTSQGSGASPFSGTHSFYIFSSEAYPLVAWCFRKGNIYCVKKADKTLQGAPNW